MVDNSGFVGGGGSKTLWLPGVLGHNGDYNSSNYSQQYYTNSGSFSATPYAASQAIPIPLFLPKITNAARDFTTTGDFRIGGQRGFNATFQPNIFEYQYRNFTLDTGHTLYMKQEAITLIRASEKITIGGSGVTNSTGLVTNRGTPFLAYPYAYATSVGSTQNGDSNGTGGGGGGSTNFGYGSVIVTNDQGGAGNGGRSGGINCNSSGCALVLIANEIEIAGNITMNGSAGNTGGTDNGGSGGGHGGFVYLIANTITYTSGTINVSGGNGGNGGALSSAAGTGGGGGGHCGILYTHAKTYSGSGTTITASVGSGGTGTGTGGDGGDGGYPYPELTTGEYKIEGSPF